MKSKFNWTHLGVFAVALVVGICLSYMNVAHAGIVADMFQEPIDDFKALVTSDLGNTMALLGVIAALGIAVIYQSMWTAIGGVLVVGVLWSSMEYFV